VVKVFLLAVTQCLIFSAFGQSPDQAFAAYEQTIPGSTIKTKLVAIQGGTFVMGSNDKEKGRSVDEGPQRKITLSPFWMGANEVTRDEFDVFWKDEGVSQNEDVDAVTRPSAQYIDLSWGMGKEGGFPVNSMSQRAAIMFCRWLSKKTGTFYRIPTEAEWEYACRAGTTSTYFFGDNEDQLQEYGWFKNNSETRFHKTGLKKPNPWGLYDMLGNVMEWTLNHYDAKAYEKLQDGALNPVTTSEDQYPKVLKGGGYESDANQLRSAARQTSDPEWNKRDPQIPRSKWWLTDAPFVGFRIVRPLQQPTPQEAEAFFKLYLGN
jgi:formylglycine-generating enzyme required for sulfatase activity